ncbi:YbhB/YbcL family Raf kinase inhibitor-like protein [Streptomyces aidingensis]|uniref:Phosphatidylethanolamine-binding protein n=1 Tax=Streptomyces aidingensis TaxID=910347 RepID=A0A1I1PZ67_9ACTN|nr:YbhB/YbcL family Raf kinase inhibitor-like protein [Streptomyces aidingensis]SFD15007.1 hypothetical protein SAMN05421773_110161 [Streptomyces aidingensis]
MAGIELKSSAFSDQAIIPRRYTKDGDNVSPPLTWSGVPDDAAELVLLCEDPDAPGGPFLHWLVTGIDPHSNGVGTGHTPEHGTPHRNGYGEPGWGGPQPPKGDDAHRYFFRLYALPGHPSLPAGASARQVHQAVDKAQLASGNLMGVYQR